MRENCIAPSLQTRFVYRVSVYVCLWRMSSVGKRIEGKNSREKKKQQQPSEANPRLVLRKSTYIANGKIKLFSLFIYYMDP